MDSRGRDLANRLAAYAPHDGAFQLRLPGTFAIRLSRMTTEPSYATLGPSLCVAAQGAKIVMLGREVFEYDPAQLLVLLSDLVPACQRTRWLRTAHRTASVPVPGCQPTHSTSSQRSGA